MKSLFDKDDVDCRRQGLLLLREYEQQLLDFLDGEGTNAHMTGHSSGGASHRMPPLFPSTQRADESSVHSLGLSPTEDQCAHLLSKEIATTILACACESYPVLDDDTMSPADMLVQLLWASPDSVSAAQIKDAYMISTRPVRRSLLHLLSLHSSTEAVEVLAHLIGPDGPQELAPAPIRVLLEPLLRHTTAEQIGGDIISRALVPTAVWLCTQPDWVFEATRFLKSWIEIAKANPQGVLGVAQQSELDVINALQTLSDQMQIHIGACNSHWDNTHGVIHEGVKSPWVQAALTDPVRGDRFRIEALLEVVDALLNEPEDGTSMNHAEQSTVLAQEIKNIARRALMSADPQVGALGAVMLMRAGSKVGLDRLDMIVRDPAARQRLYDGLQAVPNWLDCTDAPTARYPTWWSDQKLRAESNVVAWLCEVTQLGCPPHEIEWVATINSNTEHGDVEVFRFRMRKPHWSTGRGWMIAIGGPVTRSDFEAEDEWTLEDHVQQLITRNALGDL